MNDRARRVALRADRYAREFIAEDFLVSDLDEDVRRFEIPGIVRIEKGRGGLPNIVVAGDLCNGEIYLDGGHVTHFQPRGAKPVLFMSKASRFEKGVAIRGGIPVIFPWFGPRAGDSSAPAHGFARIRRWEIEAIDKRNDGSVRVVLTLADNEQTRATWPHAFLLRLIVVFSSALDVTLETRNVSKDAFEFEEALHTYLLVGDARNAVVEGLAGATFTDKVDHAQTKTQDDPAIHFVGETDRVYQPTRGTCVVRDPAMNRSITIEKEGSDATVVWNPWIDKAKAMSDFGDEEWPEMVCVETANVGASKVILGAGLIHRMRGRIGVGG